MSVEPFVFNANLSYPPDVGQPNVIPAYAFSGQYTNRSEHKYDFSGSGSKSVDFGAIGSAGAKAVFIQYDNLAPSNADITVSINSGTAFPIAAGGGLFYVNPNPVSGITSLTIVFTASCTVRVILLG